MSAKPERRPAHVGRAGSRVGARTARLAALLALLAGPRSGSAQGEPGVSRPPGAEPSAARALAEAKELNRQGIALLAAGDPERALDYFRRSIEILPSGKNTANAAISLHRLGRFDEALELYEQLLTTFPQDLAPTDLAAVAPAMAQLRTKVGSLVVTANVGGATLFVGGRERARLPQRQAIRALVGARAVRVVRPGYQSLERTVLVRAGETTTLDVELEPLREVGTLRVEVEPLTGARVLVDGIDVGAAPWEGVLPPGRHLAWTRLGDAGSAPVAATVLEGQITLVRLEAAPLGRHVRVKAEPRTAVIELDGTDVGRGSWEGRLPIGSHALEIAEAGYVTRRVELVSQPGGVASTYELRLPIDPGHPRWPKPESGRFWIEAFGGYAGGLGVGSGAEDDCPSRCDGAPATHGFLAGARGGYRFRPGIGVELTGGYVWLDTRVERFLDATFGPQAQYDVRYHVEDALYLRGPFIGAGASQRVALGGQLALVARATLGVLFAVTGDDLTGTVEGGGVERPIFLGDRGPQRRVTLLVMPELGAQARLGPVDLGLALGWAVFPLIGPELPNQPLGATPAADAQNPGAAGNAPGSKQFAGERAYGIFELWVPQLSVGYGF